MNSMTSMSALKISKKCSNLWWKEKIEWIIINRQLGYKHNYLHGYVTT